MHAQRAPESLLAVQLTRLLPTRIQDELPSDRAESASWTLAETGLTSLQTIEFAMAVEQAYDVELDPEDLLALSTFSFSRVAELVERKTARA